VPAAVAAGFDSSGPYARSVPRRFARGGALLASAGRGSCSLYD